MSDDEWFQVELNQMRYCIFLIFKIGAITNSVINT